MHRRDRKGPTSTTQESTMNVKQLLGLTALALAASTALAQDGSLTRAEVRQQVLSARAAGTLIPAGEGVTPGYAKASSRVSDVGRAQVNEEVLQARASGQLQPAGEGAPEDRTYAQAVTAPSTLARAEVKSEVLEARADGDLIPAGEGEYPNAAEATHVAHAPIKASNFFAFLHRSR
jgi:hypothetical protein